VGEDPDSLLRAEGPAALRALLDTARPLADLLWLAAVAAGRFETPERRAGVRADLLQRVGRIEDAGVRDAYRLEMLARFDEACGRRPRGFQGGKPRSGGAFSKSYSGGSQGAGWQGGSWQGRGWQGSGPNGRPGVERTVTPLAPRQSPSLLRRRPEQVLLALAIQHPRLAAEYAEELAALALSSPESRALREALLDRVAPGDALDFDAVKCHLSQQGFSRLLGSILNSARTHEPLSRPEAPLIEVRKRFGYWIERARENSGQPDAGDAVVRFAEDPTDISLARMRAERELGGETTAHSSTIQKYETTDPVD